MPRVEVVLALAERQEVIALDLREGATLAEAVAASGLAPPEWGVGVFGERRRGDEPVREGDRVEIYRPLPLDPREMRRRAAKPPKG